MPDMLEDPFADAMIPRDRWKRPLIQKPGGDTVPYTRASTFAGELDNGEGLTFWKVQHTALGVARHEDLAAQIAGLRYKDKNLPALIEDAIGRVNDKAAWGTAVHSFTDPAPSPHVPARMVDDVQAYDAKMRELGITQVDSERFVVCDELQVAGTFDGIYAVPCALLREAGFPVQSPGGWTADTELVIGDKKTGSIHMQAVGVQTGVYAHGDAYHVQPDGTPVREPLNVRTDVAILIHIPKGEGRCDIYPIDLEKGWADAHLAKAVKDSKGATVPKPLGYVPRDPDAPVDMKRATEIRKAASAGANRAAVRQLRDHDRAARQAPQPSVADRIAEAPDADALLALYTDTGNTWTQDDRDLATAKRNLLLHNIVTTPVRTP